MGEFEEKNYRAVIGNLKTALMDLEYSFASADAMQAVERAIRVCEADLLAKKSRK
jgi:hypothetical protein